MMSNYLIIGNVTKDNTPDGPILGGTSSYAAMAAHRLNRQVALVTCVGPDIPSLENLQGIQVKAINHAYSTTFVNIYEEDGKRRQKLLAQSGSLSLDDVPQVWRETPLVHLAPIVQEFSPALSQHFSQSLVCATMQGWLRGRDEQDNVIYKAHPDLDQWLSHIDLLVMSRADVFGDQALLDQFLSTVKVGVETLGPDGCLVYEQGQKIHVPVKPVEEVDPTGAGDIFAAAFFVAYQRFQDSIQAAQFANACASISVGRIGVMGTPSQAEVERQVAELYS